MDRYLSGEGGCQVADVPGPPLLPGFRRLTGGGAGMAGT